VLVFGKKQRSGLDPPDLASQSDATEILRLWVTPQWEQMQVSLKPHHPDPSVWGIALVDVARHVAKAYALNHGISEEQALQRIRQVFDAEWSAPTELPQGHLRD
jgi:hypothetical protein